jgi:hypothetical protein
VEGTLVPVHRFGHVRVRGEYHMSFVLELTENGQYMKDRGAPLKPKQVVLLNSGIFKLPRRYEETVGELIVVRTWRIPNDGGGHFLLRELLPKDTSRGWPW